MKVKTYKYGILEELIEQRARLQYADLVYVRDLWRLYSQYREERRMVKESSFMRQGAIVIITRRISGETSHENKLFANDK